MNTFHRLFALHETTKNYPPFNMVTVSNVESRLELVLEGFKKKEVNVYTQDGKLFVEGQREDAESGSTYVHRGMAQRSGRRWTLAEEPKLVELYSEGWIAKHDPRKSRHQNTINKKMCVLIDMVIY